MEEIDIIELLKRAKEGKAPERIQIENDKHILELYDDNDLEYMYFYKDDNEGNVYWLERNTITLRTPIKILDKPIIEELKLHPDEIQSSTERKMETKINEIIRHINKESEEK